MAESVPKKSPRVRVKLRRQEVRQCLAEFGLARPPCRLWRGPGSEPADVDHSRRVGLALARLGPVFASFGRYLSSRLDLLPAPHRAALAALAPGVRPLPAAAVRHLIA